MLSFGAPVVLADPLPPPLPPPPITTESLIRDASLKYNVSYTKLFNTLKCESGMDSAAIGDGGHSYGIAQIYLPAHPSITKAQALDKAWAIDWTAHQFSLGSAHIWTCYRLLYG